MESLWVKRIRPVLGRVRRAICRSWNRLVAKEFHKAYYAGYPDYTWQEAFFLGIKTLKCPFDLWVYQEIVFETKPDLIIETGTYCGGSALYFASLMDLVGGDGQVVTIDIEHQPNLPSHPRLEYIQGSSTNPDILATIRNRASACDRVMVVLDSDHSAKHVLAELNALAELVTPGCYLVVEDGNLNGHPVLRRFGPGPTEALREFLRTNTDFEVDFDREKRHMISFNPGGYLRKRSQ